MARTTFLFMTLVLTIFVLTTFVLTIAHLVIHLLQKTFVLTDALTSFVLAFNLTAFVITTLVLSSINICSNSRPKVTAPPESILNFFWFAQQ